MKRFTFAISLGALVLLLAFSGFSASGREAEPIAKVLAAIPPSAPIGRSPDLAEPTFILSNSISSQLVRLQPLKTPSLKVGVAEASVNLVPNPSFEYGATSPTDWNPCGDNTLWDSSVAHTGSRSARNPHCWWTSSPFYLPAGSYYFGFWHRETNAEKNVWAWVGVEGGAYWMFSALSNNDGQWRYYEDSFQTLFPFTMRIWLVGPGSDWGPDGQGTVWYDDIYLGTEPSPPLVTAEGLLRPRGGWSICMEATHYLENCDQTSGPLLGPSETVPDLSPYEGQYVRVVGTWQESVECNYSYIRVTGLYVITNPCVPTTYTVSGRVTNVCNNPISGVTISDSAGHVATTDSNGNYTLSGLTAGTYTFTPTKSGYAFSPTSLSVNVPPDATGQNFTARSVGPDLAICNFIILPTTPVVWEESWLNLSIVNAGTARFIPQNPNYSVILIVKDAQGRQQSYYEYSSDEFSIMDKLPELGPGDTFGPRLPSVFFLTPVSAGTIELFIQLRDNDPNLANNIATQPITISPNPDTPKNCLSAILNAISALGIPANTMADVTLGLVKLFTLDLPACQGNLHCEIKALSTFIAGLKFPVVGIISSLKDLMTQPPQTCLSIIDWIKMVLIELIQRGTFINMAGVESPAYILVTNNHGQRVGFLDDGMIIQEIPGAQVVDSQGKRAVIYPGTTTQTVRIKATDYGTMRLSLVLAHDDSAAVSAKYQDVPLFSNTIGMIDVRDSTYTLSLDDNGDGIPDRRRPPDELTISRTGIYLPVLMKRYAYGEQPPTPTNTPTHTPTTTPTSPIGDWITTTTSLPQAFGHAPAVVYNGRVYMAGGEGPSGSVRTTVYYATFQADGSLSAWSTATSLPQPRHYHAMAEANGYLYLIGGGQSSAQNTIYYTRVNADGSLGSWATTTLPMALWSPAAAVAGGRLYVLGGCGASSCQKAVYYTTVNADGSLGSWATTTPLPQNMSFTGAVVTRGRIYIAGGYTGSVWTTATYSAVINADGTLGGWNTLTSLPQGVANHVVLLSGGKLYVLGGWNGSSPQKRVYYAPLQADGTLGSWAATKDLPQTLHDHSGAVYGGCLYTLGGFNHMVGSYQSTVYSTQRQ